MPTTNINIRMDEDLKKQFEAFCADVGMNMTTAFCVFAKTAVREHRIPFEVKSTAPNVETIKAMQEVEEMIINGTGKRYTSVEDLFEDLNA